MATSRRRNVPPGESAVRKLAGEVSSLQATMLGRLYEEMGGADAAAFAAAAQQLAEEFGLVTATAVGTLCRLHHRAEQGVDRDPGAGLDRPVQLSRRLDQLIETNRRYGHPFGVLAIDVDGPGARGGNPGGAQGAALTIVGVALRESTRLLDETFPVKESGLCILAPNQTTVGGVQMAERLLGMLDDLEDAGGLRIGISAGVVSCPEHGADAQQLLSSADEAMWRARAVGQPVGVGRLQDR